MFTCEKTPRARFSTIWGAGGEAGRDVGKMAGVWERVKGVKGGW